MSKSPILSAAVLAALAGLPISAPASIFTFSPVCNSAWYAECVNGQPCAGGGWQTFNNWGQAGCAGGLATPGPADDVQIGSSTITLNGTADINSLTNSPGGVFTWSSGDLTIATAFVNNATVVIPENHKTLNADMVNYGSIVLTAPWILYLLDSVIQNQNTLHFTGDKMLYPHASSVTHRLENYSQVIKSGGGTADIRVAIHNDGVVETQSGTMWFVGTAVTSTPASSWPVAAAGAVRFHGCSLTGTINSVNDGLVQIENGWAIPTDVICNVTNNGLWWASGDLTVGAGKTLHNTGVLSVGNGHKFIAGDVVNTGTMIMRDGWTVGLSNGSISNGSVLEFLGDKLLYRDGANSALLVNDATTRKTTGGTADIRVPVINNGTVDTQNGTMYFAGVPVSSSGASAWPVAATGALRFSGCTMSGLFAGANSGLFQIEDGWAIPSSTTVNVTGNGLRWTSGDLAITPGMTLTNLGLMGVGSGHKYLSGNLINAGTITVRDGWGIYLAEGFITNSATFDFLGSKMLYPVSGANGSFINNSVVRKTVGGTADIRVPFANNGVVDTQDGLMYFQDVPVTSGGTSSWPVAATGALRFSACTMSGLFASTNNALFQIEGGWAIPSNTTVNVTGNGLWWASGDLAITPGMTLTNLGLMGVGSGHKYLSGNLTNAGTITVRDGWGIYLAEGFITNNATFDFLGSKNLYPVSGANGSFINNSVVRKTVGGTADIRVPFTNNNTVSVQDGQTWFVGVPVLSAPSSTWTVASAGTASFNSCSLSGRFSGTNAGVVQLDGGTTIPTDTVLNITGNRIIWASGDINVANGATLTNAGGMTTPASHTAIRGSILNSGTMWAGGGWYIQFDNGSLTNTGTLECCDNKTFALSAGSGGIINNALLRKTNGGSTDILAPLINNGLINIESGELSIRGAFTQSAAGTTRLAGGVLSLGPGQTFSAGKLEGSGGIYGPATNSGAVVRPGGFNAAGTLSMSSSYTQQSAGWMEIEIGGLAAANFDLLTANAASLNGTLLVRFMNGFHPMAGDMFTFLTTSNATGRTGTFSTISLLDPLDGLVIEVLYAANSATVHVIQCTPCTPCDPDVNCDGAVNGFDIETMEQAVNGDMSNFCQPDPDFNHDGTVNGFDIEVVEQVVNGGFCP